MRTTATKAAKPATAIKIPKLPKIAIHRSTNARLEAAAATTDMGPNRMADLLLEYALGKWEADRLKIEPAPMPMERGEG